MSLDAFIKARCLYDEATGSITWTSDNGKAKAGARAEFLSTNGYLMVRLTFEGKRYRFMAHRLAWFLKTGSWPTGVIDHINHEKANNAWTNLRDCTQSLNLARKRMNNRALPRGVTFAGHTNKTNPYMAQIKSRCIGYFATPELASEAYEKAFAAEFGNEWRK